MFRTEAEHGFTGLIRFEADPLKSLQLHDRSRHRREHVPDVELHDFVTGDVAGVGDRASDGCRSGRVNLRRLHTQVDRDLFRADGAPPLPLEGRKIRQHVNEDATGG